MLCMGDVRSAIVNLMTMEVTIFSDARLSSVEGTHLAAHSSMTSACVYKTACDHTPGVTFMQGRFAKSK